MSDQKERLELLFKQLDKNNDGNICLADLAESLSSFKYNDSEKKTSAKLFLESADENKDGIIDFDEFVKFIESRDERIVLAFNKFDSDKNGLIDADEIQSAFRDYNICLTNEEAEELIKRIDEDGTLKITLNEWRKFLYFHPAQSLSQIIHFWQHGNFIDAGADWIIPDEFGGAEEMPLQLKRLLCGGVAGATSRTCTAPLDRVKVLLQVHGYKHQNSGIINAIKYMLEEGGLFSLWRGNGINVVKIAPETALKYSLYEYFKTRLHSANLEKTDGFSNLSLKYKFLAGSMAGVSSQAIIYPLETLKTRMCLRKTGQYNSVFHCAKMIMKEGGIRAFYRGFHINSIGIIPYAGIELTLYEKTKSLYLKWQHRSHSNNLNSSDRISPLIVPLLSSFSATCGILTTYPFALIRTKLQSKASFSEPQVNSASGLIVTIWRTTGLLGFYRGLSANLFKVLPASSISYLTFEYLNDRFHLHSFGS